jgi:hypothetical protein
MSSLFFDTKKESYRAIRAASQGASISLSRGCDEYVATFNCATSIASVLGDRELHLEETVPTFRIPIEDLSAACLKLATRFSVALVETVCGPESIRFVLLWKIPVISVPQTDESPSSQNLDEY